VRVDDPVDVEAITAVTPSTAPMSVDAVVVSEGDVAGGGGGGGAVLSECSIPLPLRVFVR
jgi:hypothetical protein